MAAEPDIRIIQKRYMGWSCECVFCVCVAVLMLLCMRCDSAGHSYSIYAKKEVGRTAAVAAGVRVLSISLDDDHPTVYLYFLFGCVFLYIPMVCLYMCILAMCIMYGTRREGAEG